MADSGMFLPENQVAIRATERRPKGSADYFVQVEQSVADRLNLRGWGVLVFYHPALADAAQFGLTNNYLAIHCRITIVARPTSPPDQMPCVAVDQTLRNALGIPFRVFRQMTGGIFYLLPADRPPPAQFRRDLAQIFGVRYLAARCQSAHIPDIEKSYVRVPEDLLKATGLSEAGNLVVERPLAVTSEDGMIRRFVIGEYRISALIASDRLRDERAVLQTSYPERYPDAQRILYDYAKFQDIGMLPPTSEIGPTVREPDIPPIFMDFDARSRWSAQPSDMVLPGFNAADVAGVDLTPSSFVTPLMVRRSILSALAKDTLQTGIAFLIVLIQFTFAFDIHPNRVSAVEILVAFTVAVVVSAALLIARIRHQI